MVEKPAGTRRKYSPLPFWAGAAVYTALDVLLLLRQVSGVCVSDLPAHLGFVVSGAQNQYSLFHLVLALLYPLVGEKGLGFAAAALVAGSNLLCLWAVRRFLRQRGSAGFAADALALCLLLLSMLFCGFPGFHRYLGQWSPNPWHNPTYALARPFAVLAFTQLVRFRGRLEAGAPWRRSAALAGLWTLLCTAVKPSFFLVYVAACFLWCLADLLLRRGRRFGAYLFLGACLLPAAAVILLQNALLYRSAAAGAEASHIVFAPGAVWPLFTPSVPVSVLLGMAFPLYVLVWLVCMRRFRAAGFAYHSSLLAYAVGFAEFLLLAESGPRLGDANFAWGYAFGMFFLFLASAEVFFLRERPRAAAGWAGAALFCAHLVCGLVYFGGLLAGGSYY